MSRPLGISIDWNGEGRGTIVAHSEILGPQGDPSRTTLYHQVTGAVGDLLSPRRPLSSVPLLEPPEQPIFFGAAPGPSANGRVAPFRGGQHQRTVGNMSES